MIHILAKFYRRIIKNLENHQDALRKIENYKENNTLVNFPIYDLINEIEENNLLEGDLEENLRELETYNNKEDIGYVDKIMEHEGMEIEENYFLGDLGENLRELEIYNNEEDITEDMWVK
jgi:hypothetical protein